MRPLTVLIAPDSFKGSLTSVEVARALGAGWTRMRPDDEILVAPLADGGEGTLVAVEAAGGWEWRKLPVQDPLGRPTMARWLISEDGTRAVVEMAEASGLSRVAPGERDPVAAHTYGSGEVLVAVMDAGVRSIMLGIGGSATSDGGVGVLEALGMHVEDRPNLMEADPRLADVTLKVACDVTNPLLGPNGAVATYGPQKGATTPAIQALLEERLAHLADVLEHASGRRERDTPGAGAAGGLGFGLLSIQDLFGSFGLYPGVELVMDATGFDEKLARVDLVITGEGQIDAQTAYGKTAMGVARRAHARGLPIVAVGGGVTPDGIDALAPLGLVCVPVVERPQSIAEAMGGGSEALARCGERIAQLMGLVS